MKRSIAALAAILCLTSLSLGHISILRKNEQQVTFKTEKVSGNVHVLFGAGGNIGVSAGSDGILIIDDQFARFADNIKAELAKLGSDKPKFLFNTHWHGDHTGGNEIFGRDAVILAHENVRKRMSDPPEVMGERAKSAPVIALPVITYQDGVNLYFNGETVRAVHFPNGHTDGDTVLFFTSSNVVHLGDDFFAGTFPFVDIASGGSVEGLARNIAELIKQIPADAKLIPGHGPVSTVADLKAYHAMLIETTTIVRDKMKTQTLDAIKKGGLPEKYKSWSWEFIPTDKWIETIYNSYSPTK